MERKIMTEKYKKTSNQNPSTLQLHLTTLIRVVTLPFLINRLKCFNVSLYLSSTFTPSRI